MKNKKTIKMVEAGLIVAILILMAFTPLGYLKVGIIEISFCMIPVTIGGIILGPAFGAFFGAVFGVTSFLQCFGMSAFGVALMEINPVFTLITCLVPRVLAGWLSALIFRGMHNYDKARVLAFPVSCVSGALLNTVLFVGTLMLLFFNTDFIQSMAGGTNVFAFAVAFAGINSLVEAGVTAVVGSAISGALSKTKFVQLKA